MSKRTREDVVGQGRECPVCFEDMQAGHGAGAHTETWPFQCGHAICRTCDRTMLGQSDHRCPTCREPRRGMSRMQAEPPPDRNQPESSASRMCCSWDRPPWHGDAMEEYGDMVGLNQFFHAAGGYGMPPGPVPLGAPASRCHGRRRAMSSGSRWISRSTCHRPQPLRRMCVGWCTALPQRRVPSRRRSSVP